MKLKTVPHNLKLIVKYGRLPAILYFLFISCGGFAQPLLAVCFSRLIDSVLFAIDSRQNIAAVYGWMAAYVAVLLLMNLQDTVSGFLEILARQKFRDRLSSVVFGKYDRLDYAVFEQAETNDLMSRVGSNPGENLMEMISLSAGLLSAVISLVGLLMLYAYASVWVMGTALILAVLSLAVKLKASGKWYDLRKEQSGRERKAGYLSSLITSRETTKEIRVFGLYRYLANEWKSIKLALYRERFGTEKKLMRKTMWIHIFETGLLLSGIAFFVWLLVKKDLTYGEFVSYVDYLPVIFSLLVTTIPDLISGWRDRVLCLEDMTGFMNLPEAQGGSLTQTEFHHSIVFDHVDFRYPNGDRDILRDFCLTVYQGQTLAIVGENGCGKSTVIKLLLGLYLPDRGKILMDGTDMRELSAECRRHIFSAVLQDFNCYQMSVRENIIMGNPNGQAEEESIGRAISALGFCGFSDKLDKKLGKIYEDGEDLSGGQWQQLALLRSYYADRDILILDEPTASLDPVSEAKIYNSFARSLKGKTCLLISHRLGSARMADKIAVIREGEVAEYGTHEELIAQRGQYAGMFTAQASLYQ